MSVLSQKRPPSIARNSSKKTIWHLFLTLAPFSDLICNSFTILKFQEHILISLNSISIVAGPLLCETVGITNIFLQHWYLLAKEETFKAVGFFISLHNLKGSAYKLWNNFLIVKAKIPIWLQTMTVEMRTPLSWGKMEKTLFFV